MWLTAGSWMYAKWDFGFTINRSWSALRLTQVTPIAGPPITGDYNGNGVVDGADYVLWRNGDPRADGFDDDIIDEFDYFIWRENFGHTSGSGSSLESSAAVPEPMTISLLALAGLACCTASRRPRGTAICP